MFLNFVDFACNNCYNLSMSPEQIRTLRKQLKLTQQQLADLVGAQRVSIARWETNTSHPTGAYLKLLTEVKNKAESKEKRRRRYGAKV
jgi:DNA-binding transcriptional regulator YiaG